MNHSTLTAAASLFDRVVKNCKTGITDTLCKAGNLVLVFKKENRFPSSLGSKDQGRSFFGLLDKIADTHAESIGEFHENLDGGYGETSLNP